MYKSKLTAYGAFLPEHIVTNDDLSKAMETSNEWIYSRTGISQRHVSKENTSNICIKASKSLIEKFNINSQDIDAIIVATMSPDYSTPSVSSLVQNGIKATNAMALDINVACSGFVFALSTADKYIRCGDYKKILVIGGEVLTKQLNYEDRNTAVLFGDGAGAVLLERGKEGILAETLETFGELADKLTSNYSGVNNLINKEENYSYFKMDGRGVFSFVVKKVPSNILKTLEKINFKIEDIDYIVPHQANIRIIETLSKKLNYERDKIFTNINQMANTSSASIPIALNEMFSKGLIKLGSGQKIVLVGFGGGLSCGSIVIRI